MLLNSAAAAALALLLPAGAPCRGDWPARGLPPVLPPPIAPPMDVVGLLPAAAAATLSKALLPSGLARALPGSPAWRWPWLGEFTLADAECDLGATSSDACRCCCRCDRPGGPPLLL